MVDGLFVEEDAKLIKKIPLSQHMSEDSLYWPYTTLGNYTCKSDYRFLKEEEELQLNAQTPPICHKRVWKEVWQMQALPKIKYLLWRACCNVLPTKQALMQRKILEDPICERCKRVVKDSELLSWMIEKGKSLELRAYMACTIWNQRNKVRLNLQASPLHQVAAQLAEMLAHFKASTEASGMQVRSNGSRGNGGQAPQAGFVKVNFDGTVFGELNKSGVGVVIRDNNGVVLASCSEKLTQAYKAEEIETLAAQKALMFTHELGFQRAILEGDALGLIQALKSQKQNLSPLGSLVEDVKVYSNHFQRVLYSYVKRNGNSVAHILAKHAISIPDFQVWIEDVPSHIVPFLYSNVTHLH
ncbi:uncharacterized protein LOC112008270 [Quercus suber]|uniref:uncharacterized protein LOC112008270 n=1 Tax=Quercus suber TaxID=58331 RepID=UPI0032DFB3EC